MRDLDLLLSLYDAHTIVEHFFPAEDRERFHRDFRRYQNSFWGQIFGKEPFYSYENKRKLPYHKWGDYRAVLDRIAREKAPQLEKVSKIVKKEVSRRRGRSVSVIDYDDISILDIAFLLLLLNALTSNDADAKLDILEKAETPEKALSEMEKAGAPQENHSKDHNNYHDNNHSDSDTSDSNTSDNDTDGPTTDKSETDSAHENHHNNHSNNHSDGDYHGHHRHGHHGHHSDYSDDYDRHHHSYNDDDSYSYNSYDSSYDSGGDWGGGDWGGGDW